MSIRVGQNVINYSFLLGFIFSFTITFYKENVKRHEKSCMLESGSRGRPLIRPYNDDGTEDKKKKRKKEKKKKKKKEKEREREKDKERDEEKEDKREKKKRRKELESYTSLAQRIANRDRRSRSPRDRDERDRDERRHGHRER